MKVTIIMLILVIGYLAMPVEAQTANSAIATSCAPPYPIIASANSGAGYVNTCVYYPEVVVTGATFTVIGIITAPPTVAPVFSIATAAFIQNNGCTEGTPVAAPPTQNGVLGTMNTYVTTLTMTSEQCDGYFSVSLTIAVPPVQPYIVAIPINVQSENRRVDNFNYLCDAPGITPSAYSTTATTCNDPNIALSGTLTAILDGTVTIDGTLTISDDSNGWIIHQDPLSGEITVNCVGCSDSVNIGNTTVNVNVNATGNMTGNATSQAPTGFNGSLYVLLTAIGLAFAHMGETRRSNGPRMLAGGFIFAASLAIFHELERLGFAHMDNKMVDMALLIMALHWIATVYLFIPEEYETETNQT